MSTTAIIYIPESATIRDVADVIGISCGLKISEYLLPGEGVYVGGVRFSSFADLAPNIVYIDIHGVLIDGYSWRRFIFNFESERRLRRSILISSIPFDLALGVRLIRIFGGELVCQDDARRATILTVPFAQETNLEIVKREMLPLGDDEIDAMTRHAANPRETCPLPTHEQVQREFEDIEHSRINMLTTRRELNLGNIHRERKRLSRTAGGR